jgi:hypothetical protein
MSTPLAPDATPRLDVNDRVENSATDDGVVVTPDYAHVTSRGVSALALERHPTPPTADRSVPTGSAVAMSGPRSVHATFSPPKGVSSCCEDAAYDDEQPEPCGPTKPRLDGNPQLCRQVWDEFCAKQDPDKFAMDEDIAAISASLAAVALPPVARALLEAQLSLAPGSLTNGSVQVVRVRARRMEAEVVVLDPVQRRRRSAYVRLIGSEELGELARVLDLLKSWPPARRGGRPGKESA